MDLTRRSDAIVAVFPVGHNDQVMLVTDAGMVIRCPVHDIRIARRRSQGVVIFKVGDGEPTPMKQMAKMAARKGQSPRRSRDGAAASPGYERAHRLAGCRVKSLTCRAPALAARLLHQDGGARNRGAA